MGDRQIEIVSPKSLEETIELMNSDDYKDRLKAEYFQLEIRISGLAQMLIKYRNGELNFTPNCSYDLLLGQYRAMKLYEEYLRDRLRIEKVDF